MSDSTFFISLWGEWLSNSCNGVSIFESLRVMLQGNLSRAFIEESLYANGPEIPWCVNNKSSPLTLIDTPGLIEVGSLLNVVDPSMVKKISPVKEIKPKTYQIRKNQSIIIEDFLRVDYVDGERNSFTLYISNNLKVKRLLNASNHDELKDLNKTSYTVKYGEDLVISGLGFIKMVDKCQIDVYIDKSVDTYLRRNMI